MRIDAMALVLLSGMPATLWAQARVHDSAGVRIVENPSITTLPIRFRLAAKPDVVIGGVRDNPDEELDNHSGYFDAVELSDRRVLVTDATRLKLFDATGKLLAVFGREGQGPGEFRNAQKLCRFRGDSILAWDVGNRRISIWTSAGKLVREYTPPGFAWGAGGCTDNGSIAVGGATVAPSQEDRPLSTYVVMSEFGTPGATTGPMSATYYSGGVNREVQFGARGAHFVFGDEIELGATVLDGAGKVHEIFRTADRPDPVTSSNLAARSMGCTPNRDTHVCTPDPTAAKSWPAYTRMRVDQNGRSWFHLNSSTDSVWVAFDSVGKSLGKLIVRRTEPKGPFEVLRFGKDDVLIMDFDSDGARRVSVYRILPLP